jgi:hypothetical protein
VQAFRPKDEYSGPSTLSQNAPPQIDSTVSWSPLQEFLGTGWAVLSSSGINFVHQALVRRPSHSSENILGILICVVESPRDFVHPGLLHTAGKSHALEPLHLLFVLYAEG